MTYQAQEASITGGWPLEVYEFKAGTQAWRYTSGRDTAVKDSLSYEPAFIRRSEVAQTDDLHRTTLTIQVARDNPVALLYVTQPPDGVMSVTVYRRHVTDSAAEWIVLWKGRVLSCRFTGSRAELSCEPVATSLKRTGLRAHYSLLCRHALYSAGCGAAKASHQYTGTVLAISGIEVTVGISGGPPLAAFTAGMLAALTGTSARLITGYTGTGALVLSAPMPELHVGDSVRVFKGCNHTVADCRDKFNNLVNYGGFPFIPGKNPFSGDAIV